MPTITVDGPPLGLEKKRALGKALYEEAKNVYGIEHITVVIRENGPENVCVNGKMVCDFKKG